MELTERLLKERRLDLLSFPPPFHLPAACCEEGGMASAKKATLNHEGTIRMDTMVKDNGVKNKKRQCPVTLWSHYSIPRLSPLDLFSGEE